MDVNNMNANQNAAVAASAPMFFVGLAVFIVYIVAGWKIFQKAGKPGWVSLIPIYSFFVYLEIIGRPWWWFLFFLIPGVNIVIGIIIAMDLAKVFRKSATFGVVGLWLFGFIGVLMLAFGDAKYVGPSKKS